MAKNLFEVVQALLIPFALLGVVCAGTAHFESRKVRQWFWRSLAAVAVLVLAVAFLREKRLIRYNQINNIRLLAAAIVAGPAYAAAITAKRSSASALFAAVAGILLAACHLLYAVPVIFSMPFHFVSMGDTYFSTQFLMKCAGYALGWLVCALAALALCKVLSRCKRRAALAVFIPLCLASGFMSFVGIVGIIYVIFALALGQIVSMLCCFLTLCQEPCRRSFREVICDLKGILLLQLLSVILRVVIIFALLRPISNII